MFAGGKYTHLPVVVSTQIFSGRIEKTFTHEINFCFYHYESPRLFKVLSKQKMVKFIPAVLPL